MRSNRQLLRVKPALAAALAFAAAIVLSADAWAYIGPGAGLSLLGAFWALLAAVGAALAFLVTWPVRRFLRRRRRQPQAKPQDNAPASKESERPPRRKRAG